MKFSIPRSMCWGMLVLMMLGGLSAPPLIVADALSDARLALQSGDYLKLSEILLEYIDQNPNALELIDDIIADVTIRSIDHRRKVDALVQQVAVAPHETGTISSLIENIEDAPRSFGLFSEEETESVIESSQVVRLFHDLDRLQQQVIVDVDNGRVTEALRKILTGLNIGALDFNTSPTYPNSLKQQTASHVLSIREIIAQFNYLYNVRIAPIMRSGLTLNIQNPTSINQQYQVPQLVATQVSQLNNRLDNVNASVNALAQQYPEAPYLRIISTLLAGSRVNDGVGNIINGAQRQYYQRWLSEVLREGNELLITMQQQLLRNRIAYVDTAQQSIERLFATAIEVLQRANTLNDFNALEDLQSGVTLLQSSPSDATLFVEAYTGVQVSTLLRSLITLVNESIFSEPQENTSENSSDVQLQLFAQGLQQQQESWGQYVSLVAELPEELRTTVSATLNRTSQFIANFSTTSVDARIEVLVQYFEDTVANAQLSLVTFADIEQQSIALIRGSTNSQINANSQIPIRSPSNALVLLTSALEEIRNINQEIEVARARLEVTADFVALDIQRRLLELSSTTANTILILEALYQEAQTNITSASQLIAEGDLLLERAQQQISLQNGVEASRLWSLAKEQYLAALELEWDEALSTKLDTYTQSLALEIKSIENRQVVQQVRLLIGRIRREIAAQNIPQAQILLLEAEELWATTNSTPNGEIEQIEVFLSNVQRFNNAQNIQIDDPLYPVLSNYLNIANQNINSIASLGGADAAIINQLVQETQQVLLNVTSVYPYNIEAQVANLQIRKIVNPQEYQEQLDFMYQRAQRLQSTDPQQALSDLRTIRQIESQYPNIAERIVALEIELGLRIPAVSAGDLQQSIALYEQAVDLIESGNITRIDAAIILLEQSIELNANNQSALQLLDTTRINRGSSVTAGLTGEDELLLRQAESLFAQGNIARSFAIVQQLWGNSQYHTYPPLVVLRRQVGRRLGI